MVNGYAKTFAYPVETLEVKKRFILLNKIVPSSVDDTLLFMIVTVKVEAV